MMKIDGALLVVLLVSVSALAGQNPWTQNRTQLFPCNVSAPYAAASNPPPTSVHALRPADVRVVAAMGDSQTAAFGAKATSVLQQYGEPLEYRGYSWSAGGSESFEEGISTMPNIMKKFNQDLTGYALHDTLAGINWGPYGQGLDVAVSGDVAPGLPTQAKRLVKLIKADKSIDIEGDWKILTVWIGGNDECEYCKDNVTYSVEAYEKHIIESLEIVRKAVPRVFVNLVGYIDVSACATLNSSTCQKAHAMVCPCITTAAGRAQMARAAELYMNATFRIAAQYEDLDDFTVVVQPSYKNFAFPTLPSGLPDYSFTAPDCFHYNVKGHANAGIGLFNAMLQPVGQKLSGIKLPVSLTCPTEGRALLATAKNSKALQQM